MGKRDKKALSPHQLCVTSCSCAVICEAAGAGSWWWMLNEAVFSMMYLLSNQMRAGYRLMPLDAGANVA